MVTSSAVCGLVGDQEIGLVGERDGDHHALALAARKLVRIGAEALLGLRQADLGQELDDMGPRILARDAFVNLDHLAHLLLDGVQRIERGERLLEDHGDAVAADFPHGSFVGLQEIRAEKTDLPLGVKGRGIIQKPHDRERGDRLARARLTHQGHRLAAPDRERDAAHGLDQRALDAEGDGEIVNFEKGLGAHASARDGAIARAAR